MSAELDQEFVTKEVAVEMYRLGFDEDCMRRIGESKIPTLHQSFMWFKKNFRLHSFVDIYPTTEEPDRCWFMIRYLDRNKMVEESREDYMSGWFDCQIKAENSCVNKLIEIAKTIKIEK